MSRFTALTAGWFGDRFPAPTAAQERGWPAILAHVVNVIVDEIHALAPDRRGAHLALTLERLDALVADAARAESPLLASVRPQRIGLSATQRPVERVADFLTGGRDCTIV